jgi:hypothetical protein
MIERRTILQAAAALGISSSAAAQETPLPPRELLTADADSYWTRIRREQFLLADNRAYLNNGSLGVAPRPVVRAMSEWVHRTQRNPRCG